MKIDLHHTLELLFALSSHRNVNLIEKLFDKYSLSVLPMVGLVEECLISNFSRKKSYLNSALKMTISDWVEKDHIPKTCALGCTTGESTPECVHPRKNKQEITLFARIIWKYVPFLASYSKRSLCVHCSRDFSQFHCPLYQGQEIRISELKPECSYLWESAKVFLHLRVVCPAKISSISN